MTRRAPSGSRTREIGRVDVGLRRFAAAVIALERARDLLSTQRVPAQALAETERLLAKARAGLR